MSHNTVRQFQKYRNRYLIICTILIGYTVALIGLSKVIAVRAQAQDGQIVSEPAALATGEILRMDRGEILDMRLAPDGSRLAVATSAGLWLVTAKTPSDGQLLDRRPMPALWWAPDSSVLAATTLTGTLQLFSVANRQPVAMLQSKAGAISTVAWSPDNRRLATGGATGAIEIWQAADGLLQDTLVGHAGQITSLFWSPDGAQLISSAQDGSVRVWTISAAPAIAAQNVPTPTLTVAPVEGVVQTDVLNLRAGPGTTFEKVGSVRQGERLRIIGQASACAWLQVQTPTNAAGWVAAQFVNLSTPCTLIPDPSKPTATPTLPAPTLALTPTVTAITPIVQPTPTPNVPGTAAAQSAGQGCYLFQNQLGAELNVTLTRLDTNQSVSLTVPSEQERPYCLDPGRYTYTIDAPPPWAAINGDLAVKAGDRFLFPVRPQ